MSHSKHRFEGVLSRNPTQPFGALVPKTTIVLVKAIVLLILTDSVTLEELNRSQTLSLTTAAPTAL